MRRMRRQEGFLVTIEMIIIATILVIGLIVGWTVVRNSVVQELADTAAAIGNINQSYSFAGVQKSLVASTAGSQWVDNIDFCDQAGGLDPAGLPAQGVAIPTVDAVPETGP